jgi:uncharacterized delta-60 repeat protein
VVQINAGRQQHTMGLMRFDIATLALDPNFGCSTPPCTGKFEFQFDYPDSKDFATGLAIEPGDNKIIVAGRWGNVPTSLGGGSDFAVTRVLADGSAVDTSFGATLPGVTGFHAVAGNLLNGANAVTFQTDNQGHQHIVAAGLTAPAMNSYDAQDSVVARFDRDGRLDPGFGPGGSGVLVVDFGQSGHADAVNDLAVQPNGMVVTAGFTDNHRETEGQEENWAVMRVKEDGSGLDGGFGITPGGGREQIDFADPGATSYLDVANAVALQEDGRVVLAGSAFAVDSNREFAVARLTGDGRLDSTFNSVTTGKLKFNYWPPICITGICREDQLEDVAVRPGTTDPTIVGVGYHFNSDFNNPEDVAVVQLCQGCNERREPSERADLLEGYLAPAFPLRGPNETLGGLVPSTESAAVPTDTGSGADRTVLQTVASTTRPLPLHSWVEAASRLVAPNTAESDWALPWIAWEKPRQQWVPF